MIKTARETGAICQLGVLTCQRCIFGPKRICWSTFEIDHAKRILVSKYCKILHLEAYIDLCLLKTSFSPKGERI